MLYRPLQDTDLILDTETTGLDREGEDDVLELAIVDGRGTVLFNERMRPVLKLEWPEAQRIHSITPQMVWQCGTLGYHWPEPRPLLCDKTRRIWVYNKYFDLGIIAYNLHRSLGRPAGDELRGSAYTDGSAHWECAMLAYAEYAGVPGRYEGEFAWHKLQDAAARMNVTDSTLPAHSALGDAQRIPEHLQIPDARAGQLRLTGVQGKLVQVPGQCGNVRS